MLLKLFMFFWVFDNVLGDSGVAALFPPLPLTVFDSGNNACEEHSVMYANNLKNFSLWAHEMRDASAQSALSVLRGNLYNKGNFDQCVTARAPFPTQYCLVIVTASISKMKTPRDPFSIYFDPDEHVLNKMKRTDDPMQQTRNVVFMAWCIPASCSRSETEQKLNEHFQNVDYILKKENVTFTAEIPPGLCQSSDKDDRFDNADLTFCGITCFLVLAVATATFLDCYFQIFDGNTLTSQIASAFSAKRNILNLFKSDHSNNNMNVLYGIRTISMIMIIAGHRIASIVHIGLLNYNDLEQVFRDPSMSFTFHGDLWVDIFFVLGGLLTMYGLMCYSEKNPLNFMSILVHRFVRLTLSYAYTIFFYATLLYHSGSGPMWEYIIGKEKEDCRRNWWANLLYVNNYVNAENMCMVQAWFLTCDFHFFIMALCFVMLQKKFKKLRVLHLIGGAIAISILIKFAVKYANGRPPFLMMYPNLFYTIKTNVDFLMTYTKSHTRVAPYLIGMVGGYFYYVKKESEFSMSKTQTFIVSVISTTLIAIPLFSGAIFYNPYRNYNALQSAIYGALHRSIWSLGVLGLMLTNSFGTLGFIIDSNKWLLSWKIWVPMSKLCYGAYLCHLVFHYRAVAVNTSSHIFSLFDITMLCLSDIVLSFSISFGLYIAVEAPLQRQLKYILFTKYQKDSSKKE